MSADLATIISGILLLLVFALAGWRAARRRVVPTSGEKTGGAERTGDAESPESSDDGFGGRKA